MLHNRMIVTLIVILLLVAPLSAQDTDTSAYRLHTPTAAEYVGAFPELVQTAFEQQRIYDPAALLVNELRSYSDDGLAELPFSLLMHMYKDVKEIMRFTVFDAEHWIYIMVQAAYHEGMFSLSEADSMEVTPDIVLDITALDLDGDGVDEYLLHVTTMQVIESYILAYENDAGNIAFSKAPIPSFQLDLPSRQSFELFTFEDLDGDGTLEWLVNYYAESDRASTGKFYVLQWQNNEWRNRAVGMFDYRFPLPLEGYRKPDYDISDTEIRMQYSDVDGYACITETLHVLDWSSGDFTSTAETVADDSTACTVRDAEKAHFERRYLDAIELYAQAIEQTEHAQFAQYLTARTAIAYGFEDQIEDAQRVITAIEHKGLMGDLLDQLEAASNGETPLETMCHTMYDFIATTNARNRTRSIDAPSPYGDDYPAGWFFGNVPNRDVVALPSPLMDGCNIYFFDQEERDAQSKDLHEDAENAYKDIQREYIYGDYERVLSSIDENRPLLTDYGLETARQGVQYMNARALEQLGRGDEALTLYVSLYEDTPDSLWGMLARLHIQPVQQN